MALISTAETVANPHPMIQIVRKKAKKIYPAIDLAVKKVILERIFGLAFVPLKKFDDIAKEKLINASILHVDEMGINIIDIIRQRFC